MKSVSGLIEARASQVSDAGLGFNQYGLWGVIIRSESTSRDAGNAPAGVTCDDTDNSQ